MLDDFFQGWKIIVTKEPFASGNAFASGSMAMAGAAGAGGGI